MMIKSWVKWMNQAQNMPSVSAMDLASIGLESADAHVQGLSRASFIPY
jgi:hypothetical protein